MWLQYKAILRDSNFQRYKLQSFAADTNIGKRNYQICIKPNRKSTKKIWITQPVSNALDTLDAFLFWCCSEIYNERTNHAVLLLLLLSRHFNPILETRLSLYTNYIVLFQSSLSLSLSFPMAIWIQFQMENPLKIDFVAKYIIATAISLHIDFTFVINDFAKM